MPIHSRWQVPLDDCSFQQYLLGPPNTPLSNKPTFYDADRPDTHFLTLDAFRLWSQRLAAGLEKAGLKPGDRVLLFSGNNMFFPVAFLGIVMAGGIFTGANPGFVARELAYQLKDSGAKFLFCADNTLELGIEAAASVGMGKERVFRFDDELFEGTKRERLGVRNWASLMQSEEVGRKYRWFEPENPKDTICCLNYSSGTTGVPKGVMITHYNYVANATQFAHLSQLNPEEPKLTKNARWLCFLPMYHAMAQTIFIAQGPKRGIPIYIMKKFDFVQMLESVQKFKITALQMVPPIVVALAKSPLTKKYDLSSVIDIGSGAAPLGGAAIEEAEALWPSGDRKLKQGWGMTEATCSLLGWDPNLKSIPDSVGELNANCSAKIMSPDGKEVANGERGEIWVQAPKVAGTYDHRLRNTGHPVRSAIHKPQIGRLVVGWVTTSEYLLFVMKGYWNRPDADAETFVDGPDGRWMRTGDIAYVDSDGRFFIVDRMKELIKVKGNQVAPAELEALLLEHPQLADAAVVGVTIDGEEVPRAYVVVQEADKGKASEKEVAEWLAKRVTRYKRLAGGVKFLDVVPKNPSGKILRKLLRDQAAKEVGDKKPEKARL